MRKRRRMTRSGSKKLFKATALKTHKRNIASPQRGGIRM